jgi:CarD family transcriptional regulator
MYNVGDKVVHPAHGAGVIAAIEQRDVLDDFHRYYVIDLAAQSMRLMVPVRTAEDVGLRPVVTVDRSAEILAILGEVPDLLPTDFKQRQAALHQRMREGTAESLARVVRDMAGRGHGRSYSPTEARLYDQARVMLGGELALAQDATVAVALERIDALVERIVT